MNCGAHEFTTFANNWILHFLLFLLLLLFFFFFPLQVVASDLKEGPGFKKLLPSEVESAGFLATAVAFEGYLKYSALFYG